MANSHVIGWFMFGLLLPRTISQLTEGDWGDWSPCSRSCGVGVSYQDRKCLDVTDDGSCPEPRRKYSTCNLQDCPAQSGDYRYEQCANYNSRTLQGKKYKWVPYIPDHDICALNCMPKGEYFYYRWAAKVVDGTKCSPDSYDICVNGKCESLGCDLIMHSKAKEDKCRVCNGQGKNCRTITGEFTGVGDGYKEIVAIPASATNIVITENAPAGHFLALADSKGKFFLNGDYDVTNPRTYKIAGSLFRYERASSGKEEIRSLGPILEPIHAHILLREGYNNPGVSYEYSIPKSVDVIEPVNFSWKPSNYGICSATCAGGYQYRKLFCFRDRDNKEVPPYQCNATAKPATKQACNTQPCPPRWFISRWTACSTTCGQGKQVRRVHCENEVLGGDSAMISDQRCPTPKPIDMRVCSQQRYCPVWSMSAWSQCSVSCGEGIVNRQARCRQVSSTTNNNDMYLADESCDARTKPTTTSRCNPGPCTVKWTASYWSQCYPKCGRGISTRMVYCVSVTDDNQKYPDTLCDKRTRPASRKECSSSKACPAMWHGSQWSRCTASCGVGMQMRNVICAVQESNMLRIVSHEQCKASYVMSSVRKCSTKPCQAGWYIYPWQPCSKSCGIGIRRRKVKCFADSREIPSERWCDKKTKPTEVDVCTVRSCQSVTSSPQEGRTTENPTTERRTTENPTTERRTTERPTTERRTTERLTTERRTTERPTTERTTERPTTERRTTERPTTERRTTERPTTERRTTERPTTERRTTERPTTERTTERPTTERRTTERPTTERRTTERPTTERRTTERPTTERRTTERPTTERRTTERPTTERRTTDKKTTERRTTEKKTTERRTTEKTTEKRFTKADTTTQRMTKPIPAKIVEGPMNKDRFLGAEVHLRCRATGIPEPKVSWRKGMYPVSSLGERYQILSEGTLHIDKVRPEDEGTYTCFAGNFVGSMDRRDAHLKVIVPVTVKVRPFSKHEVSAGERVVLECNAQGRPAPKAYWYKDDRVFYINTRRISTTSQRITINSVQVRDSGQYKCRAEHEYGQAVDSVVLKVKEVKPVIPTTLPVCEDTTLFSCATVKRAHGCGSRYFKRACCVTCGSSS